ncbi:transglycosylase SLT domain-containing protein [Streptomyces sp. VRA16 Mangrove soil]|uniref:transglycosylase SLT domain-containing protein n=1 Tax=Streptomyces sp. VRA16 Mangrove soil TaxID=2817434 RepID=UPI001A9D6AEF|nr:transglycosylase SLT domain-containing protein [Streptomyces sp. VRA16 Mangrove soil]MBO1338111.1 transglycosylase SLT domain-containing protein [Streptomyces sp. VRA16 Mangrove soil]
MSKHRTFGHSPLTRTHKLSMAGVAALGAAALAVTLVPGQGTQATAQDGTVATAPVAFTTTAGTAQIKDVQASVANQQATATKQAEAAAKKAAEQKAAEEKAKADAEAKAQKEREAKEAASRSAQRTTVKAAPVAVKTYANNLDGWIRQSLDIMQKNGIPGTYDGLYRNIMRESTGNPNAVNGYDINAQNGTPSIGLLQVIQPTFSAYHVSGTSTNIYDPVANITAAANYAADKYGSIDNVNSAY